MRNWKVTQCTFEIEDVWVYMAMIFTMFAVIRSIV